MMLTISAKSGPELERTEITSGAVGRAARPFGVLPTLSSWFGRRSRKPRLAPPSWRGQEAWARSLTHLVRTIEEKQNKIVGLVSDRRGAGVTTLARELAAGYERFGRRVDVIDARSEAASWEAAGGDLSDTAALKSHFEGLFGRARNSAEIVVVDLPEAVDARGWPQPAFMSAGGACEVMFFVCVVGETTQADVARLVDNARIGGMTVSGLLLNDFRMPMNWLLAKS